MKFSTFLRTFSATALVSFIGLNPAMSDQILGQGRIDDSGSIKFDPLTLGTWRSGKYTSTPDALTLPPTDNGSTGNISGMSAAVPSGYARTLADKLGDQKSILDFVQAADNGDYAPAIERAAAAGVTDLFVPAGRQYTLKRAFNIPNANMRIRCAGRKTTEIRLLGANDYFGVIGNTSTTTYNFYLEGCLFTKEQASSQGAILKIQNVYKWGFDNIRVYGENKVWRVLKLVSASAAISRDVDVDNIQERAVYATAGTGASGTVGGRIVDLLFDLWYITGANSVASNPAADGLLYFEDNFEAVWVTNLKLAAFRGYGVFFQGTLANRSRNGLNFVFNPNIEATYPGSGSVYFGAVSGSQIGGPSSWVSCNNLPCVMLAPDSQSNIVRQLQTGISGTGADGVRDAGKYNIIQDIDGVGYDAQSGAVIALASGAANSDIARITAQGTLNAIRNDSGPNGAPIIDGVDFFNLRGPALTNLSTGGTYVIQNVRYRGTDLSPYFAPAASITLPPGRKIYIATGGGTIDKMDPGYFGEVRSLQLPTPTTVIRDQTMAGGSGGSGAFLTKDGKNYESKTGREIIPFQWQGQFWQQLGR